MPPYRRQKLDRSSKNEEQLPCMSLPQRIAALCCMLGGPLLLLYLVIRCEKNQCVLIQLPVVLPNYVSAYLSWTAATLLSGFLFTMYLFSASKGGGHVKGIPSSFSALLALSLMLVGISLSIPETIHLVHAEYLHLFFSTLLFCVVLNTMLMLLAQTTVLGKERDYCMPMAYFFGNNTLVWLGSVELKYFLYVHVGLVGWGLLDLLITLHAVLDGTLTAPLAFLCITQYVIVAHTLMFEKFLRAQSFIETEGLGFFWLMRVLLYLPFMHSLPVYYAATTEATMARPALMANCVFFLFGFVIYISSIHQKENFIADPDKYNNVKSLSCAVGKRLIVSGYWGIVQKPDYFGYMIMWLSWTLACGLSGVSLVALFFVSASVVFMQRKTDGLRQKKYGAAWSRYRSHVPYRIIPQIY